MTDIFPQDFINADSSNVAKGYKYEMKDCSEDKSLKADLIEMMVNSHHQNAHKELQQQMDRCCENGPMFFLDAHASNKEAKELLKIFNETPCKACGSFPKAIAVL